MPDNRARIWFALFVLAVLAIAVLFYRDQAALRLSALQPTGTRVTLTLPEFSEVRV